MWDHPKAIETSKQIVFIALTVREPLAEMGLNWRCVTPDDVMSGVQECFQKAMPHLDSDTQKVAAAWMHQEWQKPSYCQQLVGRKAQNPLNLMLHSLSQESAEDAEKALTLLREINGEIEEVNRLSGNIQHSKDHHLPLELFEELLGCLKDPNKFDEEFENSLCSATKLMLHEIGFVDLAACIAIRDKKFNTEYFGPTIRKIMAESQDLLTEWRGEDYMKQIMPPTAEQAQQQEPASAKPSGPSRTESAVLFMYSVKRSWFVPLRARMRTEESVFMIGTMSRPLLPSSATVW